MRVCTRSVVLTSNVVTLLSFSFTFTGFIGICPLSYLFITVQVRHLTRCLSIYLLDFDVYRCTNLEFGTRTHVFVHVLLHKSYYSDCYSNFWTFNTTNNKYLCMFISLLYFYVYPCYCFTYYN